MEQSQQEGDLERTFDYGENQPKSYKDMGTYLYNLHKA